MRARVRLTRRRRTCIAGTVGPIHQQTVDTGGSVRGHLPSLTLCRRGATVSALCSLKYEEMDLLTFALTTAAVDEEQDVPG
jgi:hypothetical protein